MQARDGHLLPREIYRLILVIKRTFHLIAIVKLISLLYIKSEVVFFTIIQHKIWHNTHHVRLVGTSWRQIECLVLDCRIRLSAEADIDILVEFSDLLK